MAGLRLELLGGFQASIGAPVLIPSRKARALLAYLALARGRAQSRDRLAGLLWTDCREAQARMSLRQALTALRKALGDTATWLHADGESVALASPTTVDCLEFEALVAEGSTAALEQAIALYRGDLLDGLSISEPAFEQWLTAERERLRALALGALERLLKHHSAQDDIEQAIEIATRLLTLDSLREDTHRALIRLYQRQGRIAPALAQYRACRTLLRCELGVLPEPETEALYRGLLEDRQTRPATAAHESAPGVPAPRHSTELTTEPTPNARVEPQLREIAVLIVDLSKITHVTDPEAYHAQRVRQVEVIEALARRHNGQYLRQPGEMLIITFGLSRAYGNEALRAVRTALAIHQALDPFAEDVAVKGEALAEDKTPVENKAQARIGVACGPMLVSTEVTQPAPTGQPVLTGEPMRLALSLVHLAAPGETIVSEAVQHALGDLLATEPLPIDSHHLAHRVRTLREPGAVRRPFVGRTPERRQLEAAVADCRTRHMGQVLLIRGEAGIGKTRLAEQLAVYAYGYGFTCYRALILNFGGVEANDAARALMINLLGITPSLSREGRRQAVDVATRNGLMGNPLAPELRAALNEVLDLPQPEDLKAVYQAMAPVVREAARQRLLSDLVHAACRQTPVLLIVEDIHWAPPATLAQLAVLAAITRDHPVMLAMTTRAEHDPINHAWRVQAQGCHLTTIDLGPLSATEATALAAHYGHGEDVFGHSCIQRAEGHPLFLDQLLRMPQLSPGSLPGSVQSLVLARTDQLAPLDRQALAAAAVLGQRFSLPALAHLLGEPPSRLQSLGLCDRLVEQALLRPEGEHYLFTHALIHEAVYAAILKSRRTEWHVRAAAWFAAHDPELKARHLDAAGDAQASGAYLEAARHEATHYRTERARALAERGLELATERTQRYWLAILCGELLCTLGHTVDAVAAFRQALTLAENACACCRAWIGIADGLQVLDRYDEALAALAHAETDARKCPDHLVLARMAALRGAIYFPLGNIGACLGAHEQALGLARQAGSVEAEAHALSGLGDAYYQRGQIRTAHQHFDACVRLAQQHQLLRIEAVNLAMRGVTYFFHNELTAAMDDCRRADEIAGRIGDLRTATLASIVTTAIHLYRTHWQAAKDESERGLELARRLGSLRFEAEVLSQLALALAELGERSHAEVLLEQALIISLDTGPAYGGPVILGYLAVITTSDERRHQALAQGEALLAQDCVSHCHLYFHQMAIEASLAAARWDDAARYAQRLADYTRVEPLPWADFFVCRARALARWNQGVRTRKMYGELEALMATARQAELLAAIPALEAALHSG